MKTGIKILFLTVAIITAAVVIVFYAHIKSAPPTPHSEKNQVYVEDLQDQEKKITGGFYSAKSAFETTESRLKVYLDENKIDREQWDSNLNSAINKFMPFFKEWCKNVFANSTWKETDLNYISNTVDRLKSYTYKRHGGSTILSEKDKKELDGYKEIVNKYYDALSFCHQAKWRNYPGSNSSDWVKTVKLLSSYRSDNDLKNCSSLTADLKSAIKSLAESHFNYVKEQVQRASEYKSNGRSNYNFYILPHAKTAVSEYESLAGSYGEYRNSGISQLKQNLNRYESESREYYAKVKYY